jgi:hypothetical protein
MKKKNLMQTAGLGIALATALSPQAWSATESTDDKLSKLEDRVTELEVQKALNKVNFSGVMINRYEMFDSKIGAPGSDQTHNSLRAPLTYFALNADISVSSNLKIYTTIGFSKYWNEENRAESPGWWQASEAGSFALGGSVARFDRAYAAYTFDGTPLTLAAGRMPTNMGVPINQLDGLPRQGTYPRLAFNGIFDGVAAVYNFSHLLPKDNSFIVRGFYTPWSTVSPTNRTQQSTDTNPASGQVRQLNSSTPQYVGLLEYNHTNFSFMDKIELDYMFYKYDHFYWDGFNGSNTTGNNTALANPLVSGRAQSVFLGTENLGHIGLNASVNALFYWSKYIDTGNIYMSSSYLLNLNERLDFLRQGMVVGGEYIRTDKAYYLDEWTYLNTIPFYQTPGAHGFHVYTAVPVVNHVIARVGYYKLHVDPNSITPVGGDPTFEADEHSVYGQLRIEF